MAKEEKKQQCEERVSFLEKGDAADFLHPDGERRHSMRGFQEDYVDIVDYILRCTHKIWEEHGLGEIYGHYLHRIPITTSDGLAYGRDRVIAGSSLIMSAFPDLRLYGDEVIWSGNDEEGFHTSHRITWIGRNTGHSLYGPPTGRKIQRFGIANCYVKENYIVEEWIARDEMSLILQLGYNPWELAAMMTSKSGKSIDAPFSPDVHGDTERLEGQGLPAALEPLKSPFDVEDFVRHVLHEVWNWRLVNRVNDYFAENYLFYGPSGRSLYGRGNLKAYFLSFLSMFPDLKFSVDHVYYNGSEEGGYRVAVRWTMQGTHEQNGIYGPPTGKPMQLMGISHMHIKDQRFIQEWTSFDEFSLFKQIYSPEIHGQFEEKE